MPPNHQTKKSSAVEAEVIPMHFQKSLPQSRGSWYQSGLCRVRWMRGWGIGYGLGMLSSVDCFLVGLCCIKTPVLSFSQQLSVLVHSGVLRALFGLCRRWLFSDRPRRHIMLSDPLLYVVAFDPQRSPHLDMWQLLDNLCRLRPLDHQSGHHVLNCPESRIDSRCTVHAIHRLTILLKLVLSL